jgi:rhamnogalacturonyl hydrolase YesR
MNTRIITSHLLSPIILFAALPVLLLFSNGCSTADPFTPAPVTISADSGGITDAQIRDVVVRVAKRQIHPLADGEYPVVTSLDQAKAARLPEGIDWEYPWGVMLSGMVRVTTVTSDKQFGEFVAQHNLICARYYEWLAGLENQFGSEGKAFARDTKVGKFRNLIVLGSLDSCGAMGTEMIDSILKNRKQESAQEKVVVARVADWVANKQDRLDDGTLWRPKASGEDKTQPPGTVWPDDLYMGGVFLVRYSQYTGDNKYLHDAAKNIIQQAAMEQDADGLWYHGYFVNSKQHAKFKWGRGNGWVTMTMAEVLSALPENDPLRPQVMEIFRKQIEGLKKVQADDGMWHQVLDKPELWEETSCTAMFAYGIARAVNRGWIDKSNMEIARRAFAGIAKNVTPDGGVNGTCQGTNIGMDLDYYINRQRPENDTHGRGPVMIAGTEILMAGKK